MKKQTFATRLFNFRLFLEGLKRLRVTTTTVGIITLAFSALIPIVAFLNSKPPYDSFGNLIITGIKYQTICIPASLAVLVAPIFFAVMFSFLQKRKQSDFFHAIPYTRTCVYISFCAAALVSVCAIQLAAGAVAGILWSMVPYTTYDVLPYIGLVFTNLLGSFMLSSFMMLALCVSGTSGSGFILFGLFAALPRIVMAILMTFIQQIAVFDIDYWLNESFLSPLWFYPLASVGSSISSTELIQDFLFNPATILYSVVISFLIFIAAGFLYARRHSEMAGNPAPGQKTQTLFRILFAMPLALILTTFIALNDGVDNTSICLVLFVMTALCYFLYELVTTKRAANMGKAIPGFFLLMGICVVFGITAYFAPGVYLQMESVNTENVETITVPKRLLTYNSYGGRTEMVEVDDPEIIAILTEAYTRSKNNGRYQEGMSYEVTIEKKSGAKLHRRLNISAQERSDIAQIYVYKLSNLDDALVNPENVYSLNLDVSFPSGYDQSIYLASVVDHHIPPLLEALNEDFRALTPDEKQIVLSSNIESKHYGFFINVYGREEIVSCAVSELLPQTRRFLLGLYTDDSQSELILNDYTSVEQGSGAAIIEETLRILQDDLRATELSDLVFELHANSYKSDRSVSETCNFDREDLVAVLQFLTDHYVLVDVSTDDIVLTHSPTSNEPYELWYLHAAYTMEYASVDQRWDGAVNMALAMTDDDVETLKKLLSQ